MSKFYHDGENFYVNIGSKYFRYNGNLGLSLHETKPKNLRSISVLELLQKYPESINSIIVYDEFIRIVWEGIDV